MPKSKPKKLIKLNNESAVSIRQKELLIEYLEKTPIIQICCEKLNIARSTLYRWKDEDYEFAEKMENALVKGKTMINELAESKVMKAIHNEELVACFFWLKHNCKSYIMAQKEIAHEETSRFQIEIISPRAKKAKEEPKKVYAKIIKR